MRTFGNTSGAGVALLGVMMLGVPAQAQLSWTGRSAVQPGYFTARAVFPKWDAGSALQKFASAMLERDAEEALATFSRENSPASGQRPRRPSTFDQRTELALISPTVISTTTRTFIDTGGAHPNTVITPTTFGMLEGRPARLSFRDVLRPGIDPLRVGREIVLPALNRMKAQRGIEPLESLDPPMVNLFLATPAGITWQFGPYVAGAYVEGTYNVKVPWSELARVINPNGPLGAFVKVKAGDDEMNRSDSVHLGGTAFFLERIMTPPDSVLEFTLSDAEGKVFERQTVPAKAGRTPFTVAFRRTTWPDREPKRLVITLMSGGKAWFRSEPVAVSFDGWESPQDIRLVRVTE